MDQSVAETLLAQAFRLDIRTILRVPFVERTTTRQSLLEIAIVSGRALLVDGQFAAGHHRPIFLARRIPWTKQARKNKYVH